MSFYRTLCLAAALVLPQLAPAASSVSPSALGHIEALVNYCIRVDAKGAEQYKQLGKVLVQDVSAKELADARRSKEYKASHETTTSQLKQVSADKALESCRAALPQAEK